MARLSRFIKAASEPHVREVLIRLGDLWFDRTEYGRAEEALPGRHRSRSAGCRQSQAAGARGAGFRSSAQLRGRPCGSREALARDYAPRQRLVRRQPRQRRRHRSRDRACRCLADERDRNRHASAQGLGSGRSGKDPSFSRRRGPNTVRRRSRTPPSSSSIRRRRTLRIQLPPRRVALLRRRVRRGSGSLCPGARCRCQGAHLEDAAYGAIKALEHVALTSLLAARGQGCAGGWRGRR